MHDLFKSYGNILSECVDFAEELSCIKRSTPSSFLLTPNWTSYDQGPYGTRTQLN